MHKIAFRYAMAFLIAAALATGSALADKPEWAGRDKHEKKQKNKKHDRGDRHENSNRDRDRDRDRDHDRRGESARRGDHFADQHRTVVHEYYGERFRTGRCPPGLAKKNNGCMPPGQAKKWRVGRPLAREVVYYQVPQALVVRLGPPPPQHRYVRVAADILLITVGTRMVVDAIQDLGRM